MLSKRCELIVFCHNIFSGGITISCTPFPDEAMRVLTPTLYLCCMTYGQCEFWLKNQLSFLYDTGEAAAIADWMLEEYTGANKKCRRLKAEQLVGEKELLDIKNATAMLLEGKPVQYVLGYTEFYRLRFLVNESVLIPRPETEELVDWIIKDYKNPHRRLQILDIGTGSGCIPIALKKHLANAEVASVDVSIAALKTATQNAAINQVAIQFLQLDFLKESNWHQLEKYDVIDSNPPYIPQQEKAAMNPNVTAWEPATALFVPDERPLLFYEKIALFGKTHLYNDGTVYLEVHKDFAVAVQQLFIREGYTTEIKKDMHGNERMVKARLFDEQNKSLMK